MSEATVQEIIENIKKLDANDRLLLEERLAELEEIEWQKEAAEARRMAKEKNIDQEAIDRAVENVRYRR